MTRRQTEQWLIADRLRALKVLSLPARRGPAPEAHACYEELGVDGAKPAT